MLRMFHECLFHADGSTLEEEKRKEIKTSGNTVPVREEKGDWLVRVADLFRIRSCTCPLLRRKSLAPGSFALDHSAMY
jgi:hypothetical protein